MMPRAPITEVPCPKCGKVMLLRPSEVWRRKTCSRRCAMAGNKLWLKRDPNGEAMVRSHEKLRERLASESNPFRGKRGELSLWWRGGRRLVKGYVQIGRYGAPPVLEHRLLMEKSIGRELRPDEVIHHINGDRKDNRIENLAVMTRAEHSRLHRKQNPTRKREKNGQYSHMCGLR